MCNPESSSDPSNEEKFSAFSAHASRIFSTATASASRMATAIHSRHAAGSSVWMQDQHTDSDRSSGVLSAIAAVLSIHDCFCRVRRLAASEDIGFDSESPGKPFYHPEWRVSPILLVSGQSISAQASRRLSFGLSHTSGTP
jgi:hypothetical protein